MFHKHTRESGLTLVELLIGVVLSLIVLIGVHSLFVSQTRAYSLSNQIMDMQGTARFALNLIVSNLQMAGYDPQASNMVGITAYKNNDYTPTNDPALSLGTDTQLYFTVDSDGDGVIDNNDSERFGFRVNSGRLETAVISNLDGRIASWQPALDNIEFMTISYTYADGNSSIVVGLPDNSLTGRNFNNIRSVTVSLRVRASLRDPHYTDQTFGDSYRRIYLSGEVFPRNLGF